MFLLKTSVFLIFIPYIFCKNVGIIGGHRISIQDAPFIASLRLHDMTHWCGSSIIHERFLLTAAHCITPKRRYIVVVGTDKTYQGGEVYEIENIIVHENYSSVNSDNDISIIKLKNALTFGPNVKIITMSDPSDPLVNGMVFNATGWGATQFNGMSSRDLRQVQIPLISWYDCQNAYWPYLITERMVCAGGRGKDVCSGDSGGPLTWQAIQIGITSFGVRCGGLPGVYTMVAALRPWIDRIIAQNL